MHRPAVTIPGSAVNDVYPCTCGSATCTNSLSEGLCTSASSTCSPAPCPADTVPEHSEDCPNYMSDYCGYASTSRRRGYGGDAADHCQTTCFAELGCQPAPCAITDGSNVSTTPCTCGDSVCTGRFGNLCTSASSTCVPAPCPADDASEYASCSQVLSRGCGSYYDD